MPNGYEFESEIGREIDSRFPHCRLSHVLLYRPDLPEHRRYGFEIDHLLHLQDGLVDRLLIIECKAQPVQIQRGGWFVPHPEWHDVKPQLWNQSVSLLRHLAQYGFQQQLRVEACVVADHAPAAASEPAQDPRVTLQLFDRARFFAWLNTQKGLVRRTEQSSIMGELRLGVAIPELGRPDIGNAIRFVDACRQALDHELFRRFPSAGPMNWRNHAAISGTAGMGKSVLLAYILFALSCDYFVDADDSSGTRRLLPFADRANALGLSKHAARSITVFGMSHKQVRVLEHLWQHFVEHFGGLENGHLLHFHQPAFRVWDADIPDECNVLVVDEAHDLAPEAQDIIAAWKNDDPENRYLLVACDRHQRLRLSGLNATIIRGLNFSQHTVRLRRNYRSPFPVYAASLALMFRWCASTGPKIIPTNEELSGSFGFQVANAPGNDLVLTNINDSHPGNHWCYTLSRFLTPQDALRQLEYLRKEDVLWVRFGDEDVLFDYEQLSRFTYHPMDGTGSAGLIDKYIKGQDFSVVVIEGLPRLAFINPQMTGEAGPSEEELAMWQARRELFLCASRANVFLFFVLRPGCAGEEEVENLLEQLRAPADPAQRLWKLAFGNGQPARRPVVIDHFTEEAESQPQETPAPAIVRIRLQHPVTLRSLIDGLQSARGLELRTALDQVLEAASQIALEGLKMDMVLSEDRLRALEQQLGVLIQLDEAQPQTASTRSAEERLAGEQAPEGLVPGITVEEAARLLNSTVQRVLGLLPITYSARSIITDDANLRRLRPLLEKQVPPARPPETRPPVPEPRHELTLADRLCRRMQAPDFASESKMVEKYRLFLTELLKQMPDAEAVLLRYRPRSRQYFAKSEAEILGNHPYASVHRLGTTGIYAMCTLSNESKLHVLRDILGNLGLPPGDINRLLGGF